MQIRKVKNTEKNTINDIVSIHLNTFTGFFLTFMGRGFLNLMYRSYAEYKDSGILVAFEEEKPVGFLAYSGDLSGLYKYMIRKRLIPFAWYSLGAFFRKPKVFMRLVRAFLKPGESKREEKYVELASIGTRPEAVKYVEKYKPEYMAALLLPAGITSEASIRYKNEAKLLEAAENPDKVYVEEIVPQKMKYNLKSIKEFSFWGDIATMFRTVFAVMGKDYE